MVAAMTTKAKSIAELTVTAAELGALLGITRQRCGQLAGEGVLVRVNGKFKLGEAVGRYIGHLREDQRRTTASAATVRTQEARARSIELRNGEKERALISLAESVAAIDCFCGIVLVELNALPAMLGGRDIEARRTADGHVRIIQGRIARRIGAISNALRCGSSLDEAVKRTAGDGAAA